ncbi:MAG: hypothetical protein ACE5GJ_05140 [Gemmatimonadota bacterium]
MKRRTARQRGRSLCRGASPLGVVFAGCLLPLVLLGSAAPGTAQISRPAVGGGTLIQEYRFSDAEAAGMRQYRLVLTPFSASIPLGSLLTVDASGAWAKAAVTGPEGGTARLAGPVDTDLGIRFSLGRDRAVIGAGLVLPTGTTELTLEEAAVAGVVAAELLPFAISTWGTGGGVGGDLSLAFQAGAWGVGISGGYQSSSDYEPLTGESFTYRPGSQVRARLALDREVGEAGTLSLLAGFQRFGDDAWAGSNLFRSGDRFEVLLTYAFPLAVRGSGLLFGGVYHREHGSLLTQDPTLEGATDSPSQQLFVAGTSFRVPVGNRLLLLPEADGRVFRSADGVGQGWIASAGGSADLRLAGQAFSAHLTLSPSARVRLGHIVVREGSESRLLGWEAGLTLRVEAGR